MSHRKMKTDHVATFSPESKIIGDILSGKALAMRSSAPNPVTTSRKFLRPGDCALCNRSTVRNRDSTSGPRPSNRIAAIATIPSLRCAVQAGTSRVTFKPPSPSSALPLHAVAKARAPIRTQEIVYPVPLFVDMLASSFNASKTNALRSCMAQVSFDGMGLLLRSCLPVTHHPGLNCYLSSRIGPQTRLPFMGRRVS
jgi:hypothetical protein